MILLKGVSKSYGDVLALNQITLQVMRGEIYGLIGPNGAGKTTTIKLLVGLLRPSSGQVFVNGFDVQKDGLAAKRELGYIPDEPFLYGRLTPLELMDFKGSLHDMVRNDLERRKEELLQLVGLLDHRHDLIESFSLGMRQRLAISVALLPDPSIIVVDEPLVGLDPVGMRRVKEILVELARKGRTIFISTHMLHVVEEIADRVGVLNKGTLVAEGALAALRRAQDERLESIFFRLFSEEIK
ncbi:MAG TPA: ABC transporter ATP-binding protein [Syntrophorhabdales bacterium]|nr:ABC transporter ATP-binding protein [Syntrophorhabdales bacterium]